jgi:hypothetical protein
MSASSIARAAADPQLQSRVQAMAQKEIIFNAVLADTAFGRMLAQGGSSNALMWPVAVDTELAYESALLNGRFAPGFDTDIIPDATLTASIVAHWPEDPV